MTVHSDIVRPHGARGVTAPVVAAALPVHGTAAGTNSTGNALIMAGGLVVVVLLLVLLGLMRRDRAVAARPVPTAVVGSADGPPSVGATVIPPIASWEMPGAKRKAGGGSSDEFEEGSPMPSYAGPALPPLPGLRAGANTATGGPPASAGAAEVASNGAAGGPPPPP